MSPCSDTEGNVYEGECENDHAGTSFAHGHGVMHYANGDTYVGEWVHGKREGLGRFTTARVKPGTEMRNKYVGTWLGDLKHGASLLSHLTPVGWQPCTLPLSSLSTPPHCLARVSPWVQKRLSHRLTLGCRMVCRSQVIATLKNGSRLAWRQKTA